MSDCLLEAKDLCMRFGGVIAIDGLNLSVKSGEIHGLIGPNGAGKTSFFNACSGRYPASAGEILLQGHKINGLKPHQIAALGLVRTFQHVTLFKGFSVLDNLMAGLHLSAGHSYLSSLWRGKKLHAREAANRQKALDILEFIGLANIAEQSAQTLAHGHQKMLGIGIALAASPRLLLLDEPCAGMNSAEARQMIDLIRRIRERDITLMLIEHNMQVVMDLCERITVLSFGQCIAQGTPAEVRANAEVRRAYLGSAAAQEASHAA